LGYFSCVVSLRYVIIIWILGPFGCLGYLNYLWIIWDHYLPYTGYCVAILGFLRYFHISILTGLFVAFDLLKAIFAFLFCLYQL